MADWMNAIGLALLVLLSGQELVIISLVSIAAASLFRTWLCLA